MVDLQGYLEKKICEIISAWNEDDIYAISFLSMQMNHMNMAAFQTLPLFLSVTTRKAIVTERESYPKNAGIMLFGVRMIRL